MIGQSLRTIVWNRAGGRCEYCLVRQDNEALTLCVDHIIAKKHLGSDDLLIDNLALACFHCNSCKGTDIAGVEHLEGEPVRLFNPRRDEWSAHFAWDGAVLLGLTPIGRVTIQVLCMNHE
jgi:5-methylcytosine-specific restriction endonuclease McrA